MGLNTMPFDIPSVRLENPPAPAHVRIGWFRSVYNLPRAWVIRALPMKWPWPLAATTKIMRWRCSAPTAKSIA